MIITVDHGIMTAELPRSMLDTPWAIERCSILISSLQILLGQVSDIRTRINVSDFGSTHALSFCATKEYQHLLIPDVDYIRSFGYVDLRRELSETSPAFRDKQPYCFWRGALTSHGPTGILPAGASLEELAEHCQRLRLCLISEAHSSDLDARCTNIDYFPRRLATDQLARIIGLPVAPAVFGQYQMMLDVDGFSNSWQGLFLKFLTGGVVLKVASPFDYRQWYYRDIQPWVHYIPVDTDMRDLLEKIQWVRENKILSAEIAANGRRFAQGLDFADQIEFLARQVLSPEEIAQRTGSSPSAMLSPMKTEARPSAVVAGAIEGSVDTLNPLTVVRGWARQAGDAGPLRIEVESAGGLIGEGHTGEHREVPAGDCGFTVGLSAAISLDDLFGQRVRVYALGGEGARQQLPVSEHIRRYSPAGDAPVAGGAAGAPGEAARLATAWLDPGGDEVLAPVCRARELQGSVEAGMPEVRSGTGVPRPMSGRGPIEGFVDTFVPPDVLSGWASQAGRTMPLPIKIFAGDKLIGEGRTGQTRSAPPGNCGFLVKLVEPITLADVLANRVKVYAVAPDGNAQLKIWDNITRSQISIEAPKGGGKDITEVAADRAFEAAKPYVSEGELLPPVCSTVELRSSIETGGLRGFLPDVDIANVLDALEKDDLPIPAPSNREGYFHTDHTAYWLFGLDDFYKIKKMVERGAIPTNRVLDFGGSTGRVFRHFLSQGLFREIYACDFKQVSVNWCKLNFPSEIRIFLNTFLPSLPFPDNFFDMVTAFSVFTHVDEFEDAWLLELRRILRPDGIAYITIHDEHTWDNLRPRLENTWSTSPQLATDMRRRSSLAFLRNMLMNSPQAAGINFAAPMTFDRRVFSFRQSAHYSCNVFHSADYIRRYWGRYFEIEDIQPFAHNIQAVVIARKIVPDDPDVALHTRPNLEKRSPDIDP